MALALLIAYAARASRSLVTLCRAPARGAGLRRARRRDRGGHPDTGHPARPPARRDGSHSAFGISTGLILTGGIAALVYAYLVRFLAVALQSVEAGLAKVTPSMDDAARSLGTAPLGILTRVHAPLLAPSLLTAALMVFVDVMKELPATFMMRPFNFDTLAVHAYNLAADERLSELAAPALTIVAAGLVPLVVLSRSGACARGGSRR